MSVPGFGIGVSLGFGLRLSHNSGNNESYEELKEKKRNQNQILELNQLSVCS
jgi:hypothetical protein